MELLRGVTIYRATIEYGRAFIELPEDYPYSERRV